MPNFPLQLPHSIFKYFQWENCFWRPVQWHTANNVKTRQLIFPYIRENAHFINPRSRKFPWVPSQVILLCRLFVYSTEVSGIRILAEISLSGTVALTRSTCFFDTTCRTTVAIGRTILGHLFLPKYTEGFRKWVMAQCALWPTNQRTEKNDI
jgi:hypothetical protein